MRRARERTVKGGNGRAIVSIQTGIANAVELVGMSADVNAGELIRPCVTASAFCGLVHGSVEVFVGWGGGGAHGGGGDLKDLSTNKKISIQRPLTLAEFDSLSFRSGHTKKKTHDDNNHELRDDCRRDLHMYKRYGSKTAFRCCACKTPEKIGEAFSYCSRCHITMYCSRECQQKDWKEGGHKKQCDAFRKFEEGWDRKTRRQMQRFLKKYNPLIAKLACIKFDQVRLTMEPTANLDDLSVLLHLRENPLQIERVTMIPVPPGERIAVGTRDTEPPRTGTQSCAVTLQLRNLCYGEYVSGPLSDPHPDLERYPLQFQSHMMQEFIAGTTRTINNMASKRLPDLLEAAERGANEGRADRAAYLLRAAERDASAGSADDPASG